MILDYRDDGMIEGYSFQLFPSLCHYFSPQIQLFSEFVEELNSVSIFYYLVCFGAFKLSRSPFWFAI